MFADGEAGRVTEDREGGWRNLKNGDELAFVGDFLAGKRVICEIEPGVAVRIGDRFDQFVGEGAVGGINQLTIGRARSNLAAGDVLERLDGVEDMADV